MIRWWIVCGGLVRNLHGEISPHPAWQALARHKRRARYRIEAHTPLSLIAWAAGAPPAALLWPRQARAAQAWVATPFVAAISARAEAFPRRAAAHADAMNEAFATVASVLGAHGFRLARTGSAWVALADRVWDVAPPSFAEVCETGLPKRTPAGRDAARWMRMLTEAQMALRAIRSPVQGIWLWGAATTPVAIQTFAFSHDPELGAILNTAHAPQLAIVEADAEENQPRTPPERLTLIGAGEAWDFRRAWLPWPKPRLKEAMEFREALRRAALRSAPK
ncbi:MAG: hypothetical protein D6771_06220 [Zetaproteobacteria bacterium]|nr:MAG: hypothetical protein D6771_06220 [Zetaproteobacteria bacterium]